MTGALSGLRVVEFDAIGPAPFCGKLLADHGASVLRIGRPGGQPNGVSAGDADPLLQGRPIVALDLKVSADRDLALELVGSADALIEGYRPGVMERLGLGPDEALAANPRLIYGRITGYGQSGPLSLNPGHDINFIALTGALHAIGHAADPPSPPLNLLGDYGGGGMLLAFGLLAAHLHALRTGRGQVVDAAMVDGAVQLMSPVYGWTNAGIWSAERGTNFLDGSAPFYGTYRTADDRFIAVGAIEARFYAAFRNALGLADPLFDDQMNTSRWPAMRERIGAVVAARTLAEWQSAISIPDACLTPVLSCAAAPEHPHIAARAAVCRDVDGRLETAPAPRLSATPAVATRSSDLGQTLAEWPITATCRNELVGRR